MTASQKTIELTHRQRNHLRAAVCAARMSQHQPKHTRFAQNDAKWLIWVHGSAGRIPYRGRCRKKTMSCKSGVV